MVAQGVMEGGTVTVSIKNDEAHFEVSKKRQSRKIRERLPQLLCKSDFHETGRCRFYLVWYVSRMSQDRLIRLKSTKSKHVIWTRKNKKGVERKIELMKFDPTLRKRVPFKEAKK